MALSRDEKLNLLKAAGVQRTVMTLDFLEGAGFTIYAKKRAPQKIHDQVAELMNDDLRAKIVQLHNEGLANQEIAQLLNINHGRVSETLRGKNDG